MIDLYTWFIIRINKSYNFISLHKPESRLFPDGYRHPLWAYFFFAPSRLCERVVSRKDAETQREINKNPGGYAMKPSLSFFLKSFIIIIILSAISIPASAQTVGADGSFNYTIPIELPEGTAGMAPELALVYNSNSDNGMLGVGWSLAGLPCITRDSTYTIQYDGGDSFVGAGWTTCIDRNGFVSL